MFAAGLIVFRESLEAALFIGIVAAATRQLAGRSRWLSAGVVAGALGAVLLAVLARQISSWAGGIGQDLVNIGVQSLALLMLIWHCVWVTTHSSEMVADARRIGDSVQGGQRPPWALLVVVALAVLREGAETVLFLSGMMAGNSTSAWEVLGSGSAGLAAGVLVGYLLYAGLSRIPLKTLFATTNVLVALFAGAIASQLAKTLGQAGLIDAWSAPLWDSSALLATDSALGTVLHALVGYDANPSGAQFIAYVGVLAVIYFGTQLAKPAPLRPTPGYQGAGNR